MTRQSASRVVLGVLLCLFLAGSVASCGKRGSIRAPDGKEKEYTHPRQYPR